MTQNAALYVIHATVSGISSLNKLQNTGMKACRIQVDTMNSGWRAGNDKLQIPGSGPFCRQLCLRDCRPVTAHLLIQATWSRNERPVEIPPAFIVSGCTGNQTRWISTCTMGRLPHSFSTRRRTDWRSFSSTASSTWRRLRGIDSNTSSTTSSTNSKNS